MAIKATDREGGLTLRDFWKNYNIWNAINNIRDSWAKIKESTMKTITNEIVYLNLDVNNEDVDELIESHSEPLSNEYLFEQQELNEIQNESEEKADEPIVKTFTIKNMNEAFKYVGQLIKTQHVVQLFIKKRKKGWYSTIS